MSIPEADMSMTTLALPEQGRSPDDALLVKFFLKSAQNQAESDEAGRPIFHEREYISISVPGQRDSVVVRPAREADKNRFPRHYQAFKSKGETPLEGTPLESWPGITRSQVEELKFFKVQTVEQLAALNDSNAQNFRNLSLLRTKAKLFLESADANAANEKMAKELELRDNEIATLKGVVKDMQDQISKMAQVNSDPVSDSGGHAESSGRRGGTGTGN